MLTDRGTEYCGKLETHDYELYLGINSIEHTKTKTRHPQTNGICKHFHKTILHEFYQVAFRKKLYHSIEELQIDLGVWLEHYNTERAHQPYCTAILRLPCNKVWLTLSSGLNESWNCVPMVRLFCERTGT